MKANDETKKKTETPEAETPLPADNLESVSGGYKPFSPMTYGQLITKKDTSK